MAFVPALDFLRDPDLFADLRSGGSGRISGERSGDPDATDTVRSDDDRPPDALDRLAEEFPVLPRGIRRG